MNIHLTDEQFRALWGLYPDDEGFREAAEIAQTETS